VPQVVKLGLPVVGSVAVATADTIEGVLGPKCPSIHRFNLR
jgi:hypothetical protein